MPIPKTNTTIPKRRQRRSHPKILLWFLRQTHSNTRIITILLLITLGLFGMIGYFQKLINYYNTQQHEQDWKSRAMDLCRFCRLSSINKNDDDTSLMTAMEVWNQYSQEILQASKHPDDPKYSHEEYTKFLLQKLSPTIESSISNSISSNTLEYSQNPKIQEIIQLVQNHLLDHEYKLQFENQKIPKLSTDPPPRTTPLKPIRIAVVGGSTTEGNACPTHSSVPLPHNSIMSNSIYCAWPYRFNSMLNSIFTMGGGGGSSSSSKKWVEVVNMAEDGTETALMTPLLRNWVYPKDFLPEGPDIVINAYSYSDYSTRDTHFEENVVQDMMEFVKAVEQSHPCGNAPLLIFLHDAPIVVTSKLHEKLKGENKTQLYSNLISIQINELMDLANQWDLEYHEQLREMLENHVDDDVDDDEDCKTSSCEEKRLLERHVFHLAGGPDKKSPPFGMAGHMILSWAIAFRGLEVLIQYCKEQSNGPLQELSKQTTALRRATSSSSSQEDTIDSSISQNCKDASTGENPCVFAWFAGPAGTVFKPSQIKTQLQPYVKENFHWEAKTDMSTGYSRKTGLVASQFGASLTLEFVEIEKEVRYLNFMVVKSSELPWFNGVARFTVEVIEDLSLNPEGEKKELSFDIHGNILMDDKNYDGDDEIATMIYEELKMGPVTYPFEVDLKDFKAPVGSTVRLTINLVEGESFKILGMMLCS